jgi:hypothetical protein
MSRTAIPRMAVFWHMKLLVNGLNFSAQILCFHRRYDHIMLQQILMPWSSQPPIHARTPSDNDTMHASSGEHWGDGLQYTSPKGDPMQTLFGLLSPGIYTLAVAEAVELNAMTILFSGHVPLTPVKYEDG